MLSLLMLCALFLSTMLVPMTIHINYSHTVLIWCGVKRFQVHVESTNFKVIFDIESDNFKVTVDVDSDLKYKLI